MEDLIYFDNAATTFPKPEGVYREVRKCIEEYCGNPGRSAHVMSRNSEKAVYECRCELASLFDMPLPENVIFTLNTSYAINLAIKSLVRSGDHVIVSNIEHNSVLRPLHAMGIEFDVFNSYQREDRLLAQIRSLIRPNTKMIICSHQSNICPLRNPINSIGNLCRQKKLYFVVDAAQSAGILPISMKTANIDALCLPSHKSLYGIQGCGAVIYSSRFKEERAKALYTFAEGGNGVNSLDINMPDFLPERMEAGTLPTPAIAGLCEGIRAVKRTGIANIREHENMLYRHTRDMLANHKDIILYAREFNHGQTLLFNVKDINSAEIASRLDKYGICVRSGFHCAPYTHKLLDTGDSGAVRISFGTFNTLKQTDTFFDSLCKIIKDV